MLFHHVFRRAGSLSMIGVFPFVSYRKLNDGSSRHGTVLLLSGGPRLHRLQLYEERTKIQ